MYVPLQSSHRFSSCGVHYPLSVSERCSQDRIRTCTTRLSAGTSTPNGCDPYTAVTHFATWLYWWGVKVLLHTGGQPYFSPILTDLKGRIIPLIILRDGKRVPVLWTHLGSNQGPTDYESAALTYWAMGPKCGSSWTRTNELERGKIYSLLPLPLGDTPVQERRRWSSGHLLLWLALLWWLQLRIYHLHHQVIVYPFPNQP